MEEVYISPVLSRSPVSSSAGNKKSGKRGTRCQQPLSLQCCLWWCAGDTEHTHKLPRSWHSARGWSTLLLMMYLISSDADQFQMSFCPFPHLQWNAAGPPVWSVAGLQCVCKINTCRKGHCESTCTVFLKHFLCSWHFLQTKWSTYTLGRSFVDEKFQKEQNFRLGTEKLHESVMERVPNAADWFPQLCNISWSGSEMVHVNLHKGQKEKKIPL